MSDISEIPKATLIKAKPLENLYSEILLLKKSSLKLKPQFFKIICFILKCWTDFTEIFKFYITYDPKYILENLGIINLSVFKS